MLAIGLKNNDSQGLRDGSFISVCSMTVDTDNPQSIANSLRVNYEQNFDQIVLVAVDFTPKVTQILYLGQDYFYDE